MGIVLANTAISLDGFIAGPNHEMDWVFDHDFLPEGPIDIIEEVIATTGAILSGRGSYGVGEASSRGETSGPFGGRWSGPEFVLTHRPPPDPPPGLRFLSGDIRQAVATARAAAGGKNLLVLGANVTQQCLEADLVDEILLFQLPLLLGDGIRLFGRPGYRQVLFETILATRYGQAAALHFRRRRA
jgi:dihydrofolate reductase